MKHFSFVSLALSSTLLLAEPLTQEEAVQKGENISAALVQKLGGELKAQMQAAGPLGALRFCSQNALVITDQVAQESKTAIKRVSLQNRNPLNAASAEEQTVLNEWSALQRGNKPIPAYAIKPLPGGGYTYYKPITINNETCLKCHGDIAADSPIGQAIKSIYADDKATGYGLGDLRGMIVITLPKRP